MTTYEPRMVWSRVASGALAGGLVSVAGMVGALLVALPYVAPSDRRLECVSIERPADRQPSSYRRAGHEPDRRIDLYCSERGN